MTGTSFETFLMEVLGGLFLFIQLGIAVAAVITGLRGPKTKAWPSRDRNAPMLVKRASHLSRMQLPQLGMA
jgi:hypothetical protein